MNRCKKTLTIQYINTYKYINNHILINYSYKCKLNYSKYKMFYCNFREAHISMRSIYLIIKKFNTIILYSRI